MEGRAGVKSERRGALCGVCGSRKGAVVRCGQGHCSSAFHPLCARNAGLYLAVCPLPVSMVSVLRDLLSTISK